MTDELEPVAADGPQPDQDAWRRQYSSTPAPTPAAVADGKSPLIASSAPATAAAPAKKRPLSVAFLAVAVVALLGALVWALAVIGTGYNIGFLAVIVGAATGITATAVAGSRVGGFERALAGVFAGCAIIVGYYVIFVHAVKDQLHGVSVSYFDSRWISFFVHHFGRDVGIRPIDWLWIILAVVAAFRVSGSRGAGHRSSV